MCVRVMAQEWKEVTENHLLVHVCPGLTCYVGHRLLQYAEQLPAIGNTVTGTQQKKSQLFFTDLPVHVHCNTAVCASALCLAAMGVNPCTHTNKNLVRPSSIFTSKISVLLGVSCINFEFFYIDQFWDSLFPETPMCHMCS